MKDLSAYLTIAGVCLLVLGIVFFKNKMDVLLRFLLRGAFGTVLIYIINQVLAYLGMQVPVGINPVTVLTSMILGIPGVCALYIIAFV
ncbi:MAG: pro-sigmaK processing inhibitor BofA family protein [Lachnospiraceae bacterium]|nr:pro-sigmaK processing inhibitor BofA family protein [Lachnospiraceae bacterium]